MSKPHGKEGRLSRLLPELDPPGEMSYLTDLTNAGIRQHKVVVADIFPALRLKEQTCGAT